MSKRRFIFEIILKQFYTFVPKINILTKKTTSYWWDGMIKWINQIHPVLLIFLVLCVNFLSFVSLNNEEQYLLYAQQHFNPDWIPGSFIATEFPGNRLLFELLFGWVIHLFGFEATVFFGRMLNFFLLALPLAGLFRLLKINNTGILLKLQLFILLDQSFYAGEWIFGSIESKTFAYIFVLWSLLELLKNRLVRSVLLMVVATYFHILVGGWFAVSCFIWLLLRNVFPVFSFKKIINELPKLGLLYALPLIPLLYYLATNLLIDAPKMVDGVNLDHIYVYYRNKHHIGLFYSYEFFLKYHAWKILIAIGAFLLFFKKNYTSEAQYFSMLKNLMLIMLSIGFFFIGVSWVDKVFFDLSGGFLLKSYPFRMQSLAFLIFIILIINDWQKKASSNLRWRNGMAIAAIICLLLMLVKGGQNLQKMIHYQSDEPYNEVINFIKNSSKPTDAVMIIENKGGFLKSGGRNNQFGLDLIRRTQRDNFVHFKFVPGGTLKLYEWYQRLQLVEKIEQTPDFIHRAREDYRIDYILTPKDFQMPLEKVFENERYQLYR